MTDFTIIQDGGGESLSFIEVLPPNAAEIYERESDRRVEDAARYDAGQEIDAANRQVVADAKTDLRHRESHPNAKPAAIERAKAKVAKAEAKFLAAQANRPKNRSLHYPLEQYLRNHRGPWKDALTTDVAIDGKSDAQMVEEIRNLLAMNGANRLVLEDRPLTRDAIEDKINREVDARAKRKPNPLPVRSFRRPFRGQLPDYQNFVQGNVIWPQHGVYKGEKVYKDETDLEAVFFWLHGDAIKKKLIAEAVAGIDATNSMGLSERREQFAKLDAERMQILRRLEFWYRRCDDSGIRIERDWAFEPMAYLDIEPA